MARPRILVVVLAAAVGVVLAVLLVRVGRPPEPVTARPPAPVPSVRAAGAAEPAAAAGGPAGSGPLSVLRSWDARRAAAYAAGDVDGLRGLYTSGSSAGAVDVQLLRGYRSRGFRVVGMRTQVQALTVLAGGPTRCRVLVTDRLVGAVAVGGSGERIELPRDRVSTRAVTLGRGRDGGWRVSEVRSAR
jgi:hypothetical protein